MHRGESRPCLAKIVLTAALALGLGVRLRPRNGRLPSAAAVASSEPTTNGGVRR